MRVAVRLRRRRSGSSRAAAPGGEHAGTWVGRRCPASSCSARQRSRRVPRWSRSPSTRSVSSTRTRPRASSGTSSSGASGLARTPAVQTSVLAGMRITVREHCLAAVVGLERRADVDLDASTLQPARRVLPETARDLGEDLRGGVDEHPALGHLCGEWGRSEARHAPCRVSSASASTPAYPAPTKTKPSSDGSSGWIVARSSCSRTRLRSAIASARSLKPIPCSASPGTGNTRVRRPERDDEPLVSDLERSGEGLDGD